MTPQPIQRTERVIAATVGLFRVAQHLPYLAASIGGWSTYAHPAPVRALFVVSLAWSAWLLTFAYRRAGMRAWLAVVDVAFYAAMAMVVGRECLPGQQTGWDNWSFGPMVGAAAVGAMYLRPRAAAAGVAVLAAAYIVGVFPRAGLPADLAAMVGNGAIVVCFSIAGGLAAATLRRSAREADEANRREFEVRLERDTGRLLFDERTRQYRLLHDTVLSTLSAIARGGLDHRAPEIQKRCADDADLLRGLITGVARETPTTLAAALAEVSRAHAELGLQVRQQYDGLPGDLPHEVVEAIAHAVREALNNVAKHAGTPDAWVTAAGEGTGGVRVTVTDRGAGFDRSTDHGGFGINQSIRGRMRAAGGRGRVHSWAGEGTEVEIEWPAETT